MKSRNNLIVVWLLLFSLISSAAVVAESPPEKEASVATVARVMALVKGKFIDDPSTVTLINGAIDGLEKALVEKELPPQELTRVSEEDDLRLALRTFAGHYAQVASDHPELLDDGWLAQQSIDGLLATLKDRHSRYLTAKEYKRLKESMRGGDFGGLGVYIELDKDNENWLTVVEPVEGTPAAAAGLQKSDIIRAVDGVSTKDYTIEQAQAELRGPVGSSVVLTIGRAEDELEVPIVRAKIQIPSVRSRMIERDGHKVGYLRLRMFGEKTADEVKKALTELQEDGAEAFLLDLRNNAGGYLYSAVEICSNFLPGGSEVVSMQQRGADRKSYKAAGSDQTGAPLVVLVNQFSASASEITAAALQEYKRGSVVGVKTYGKGSVQQIFPLPDGSALKLTIAHYHTPTGKDINELGVEPDVMVEPAKDNPDKDLQLDRAVETLIETLKPLGIQTTPLGLAA